MLSLREPEAAERSVLLLAQYFPPTGGAGVQRASKLAKYLPGTGWKPVVLTKRRDYPPFDQELVRDSREVEVIRAKTLELPERWLALPGLRTLVRLVRYFSVPDQGIWWLPSAYAAAVRRARGESFRAIVATGGPFSTFLLALALRRRLQLPLVLDFRDPWTSNPRRQPRAWYVFWRDRIERWMERAALRRADAVVTVNPEMLDELCWPKGEKSASDCRRVAIPNGFDSDDFREPGPSPIPRQRPGSVHLVYVGGLLQEYRPAEVLLKGMRHFVALRPEVDLHCHIVGDNAPFAAGDLAHRLHFHGYLPHSSAVAAMCDADVLLLLTAGHRHDQTGKLFEYLAARRPLLLIAEEDSAAARITREHPAAELASPGDAAAFAAALARLLDRSSGLEVAAHPEEEHYSRKNVARRFSQLLEDLSDGAERSGTGG